MLAQPLAGPEPQGPERPAGRGVRAPEDLGSGDVVQICSNCSAKLDRLVLVQNHLGKQQPQVGHQISPASVFGGPWSQGFEIREDLGLRDLPFEAASLSTLDCRVFKAFAFQSRISVTNVLDVSGVIEPEKSGNV